MRLRLIDDIKGAWKLHSVLIASFGAVLTAIAQAVHEGWVELPDTMRDLLPEPIKHWAPTVFFVATVVARLIKQSALPKQDECP